MIRYNKIWNKVKSNMGKKPPKTRAKPPKILMTTCLKIGLRAFVFH